MEKIAANRATWFSDLQLPDKNHKIYVTKCTYSQWRYTGNKLAVVVKDIVMDAQHIFNAYDVHHFAYRTDLDDNCILVTNELKTQHNISIMDQQQSSSFFSRLYNRYCQFMDQSS